MTCSAPSAAADEHGDTCVVVTGDRDSLQLLGGGTTVMLVSTRMGQTTYQTYDTAAFREKYGFDPIRLIDLKALMGDSSDNIPGVPGIGEKTAMQLLHDFGTLEGVYANIDDERIKKRVRAPSCRTASSPRRTASGLPPSTAMCRSSWMWSTCPRRTSTRPRSTTC